jgi:hypothetical protein
MSDHVFLDRDPPDLGVDLDDRDMRGIASDDGRRLPVMGLLEPGIDALRAAVTQAGARCVRQFGAADHSSRHADDADPAVAEFEVRRGAFQQIYGRSAAIRSARPGSPPISPPAKERLAQDEVERIRL